MFKNNRRHPWLSKRTKIIIVSEYLREYHKHDEAEASPHVVGVYVDVVAEWKVMTKVLCIHKLITSSSKHVFVYHFVYL